MDPELLLILQELAEVSLSSETPGVHSDPQLDECITIARMIVAREPPPTRQPAAIPMTEDDVASLLFGAPRGSIEPPPPNHFDPGEPIEMKPPAESKRRTDAPHYTVPKPHFEEG